MCTQSTGTEQIVNPSGRFTTDDVRLAAEAALVDDVDWQGLVFLAGKLAMLLPRREFTAFVHTFVREQLREENYGTLSNFVEGMLENAPSSGIPIPKNVIADLLACPDRWLREATLGLVARQERKRRGRRATASRGSRAP